MFCFEPWRQLSDDCPRLKYQPSNHHVFTGSLEVVKGLHYGQRKLLLSEIEFITAVCRTRALRGNDRQLPLLFVYAGAANGSHLPYLFSLFSSARFVLIDPAPFCGAVQSLSRDPNGPIVELVEGCCTDELCMRLRRDYSAAFELFLISDIRSGTPSRSTNKQHTEMILRDNEWQKDWCWSLGATAAMLKFHPPYPRVTDPASPKYDASDDTPQHITYLDGFMLFGVWAPKSSSEVRLVVEGPFTKACPPRLRSYDCTEFEERCYAYNTSSRFLRDTAAEKHILTEYLRLQDGTDELERRVVTLSSEISEKLGFPLFRPLELSEDECRAVSLLYLSRDKGDINRYLPQLRHVTPTEMAALVADKYLGVASCVTARLNLDDGFWSRVATSKNLGEAYSFNPLPFAVRSAGKRVRDH